MDDRIDKAGGIATGCDGNRLLLDTAKVLERTEMPRGSIKSSRMRLARDRFGFDLMPDGAHV
jgi:hypothetical protein